MAAGEAELSPTEFDLGKLYAGTDLTRRIEFRNTSTGKLTIKRIASSCGCTEASLENSEIVAGQWGAVLVRIKVPESPEDTDRKIWSLALFAQESVPLTVFRLTATIIPAQQAPKMTADIHLGERDRLTIAISNQPTAKEALKLDEILSGAAVKVLTPPRLEVAPGASTSLVVLRTGNSPEDQWVAIATNDPYQPRVVLQLAEPASEQRDRP